MLYNFLIRFKIPLITLEDIKAKFESLTEQNTCVLATVLNHTCKLFFTSKHTFSQHKSKDKKAMKNY